MSFITPLISFAEDADMVGSLVDILSLAVQMVPLFALPFLLKFSGGILSRIGGVINNPNKGPFDWMKNRVKDNTEYNKNRAMTRAFNQGPPQFDTSNRWGRFRQRTSPVLTRSGNAQRAADRRAMHEAAKYESKRAEVDYVAQRQMDDANYATRIAGGDTTLSPLSAEDRSKAIARTQAKGISQLNVLRGEEKKAGIELIEERGLSNSQWLDLQAHGYIGQRDANNSAILNVDGTPTRDSSYDSISGDFFQTAAISRVVPGVQPAGMRELLKNAHQGSELVREIAFNQIQANYAGIKAKSHTFNDEVLLNKMRQGQQITDDDLTAAAGRQLATLTDSVFSGQSDQDLKWALSAIHNNQVTQAQKRKLVELANAAIADSNLAGNFSPESLMVAQQIAAEG